MRWLIDHPISLSSMARLLHWHSGCQTFHWRSGCQTLRWRSYQTSDIPLMWTEITACTQVRLFLDLHMYFSLPICAASNSFLLEWLFPTLATCPVNKRKSVPSGEEKYRIINIAALSWYIVRSSYLMDQNMKPARTLLSKKRREEEDIRKCVPIGTTIICYYNCV